MDNTTSITEKAADYVFRLFREKENGCCPYHNYAHTAETVDTCREIAEGMNATTAETEILLLAAWFHDMHPCNETAATTPLNA